MLDDYKLVEILNRVEARHEPEDIAAAFGMSAKELESFVFAEFKKDPENRTLDDASCWFVISKEDREQLRSLSGA